MINTTDLLKAIRYGQHKAKVKGERVEITPELIREAKWMERLDSVCYLMITGQLSEEFFDMRELIEQCPNKEVRDSFNGLLDEWNQMRAEQLPLVAEDYYDSRMDTLLCQAGALVGAYEGVEDLLSILGWYMNR